MCVSGANRHDSMLFEEVIDAVPPVAGRRGRPRQRPDKVHADKGYDYPKCRRALFGLAQGALWSRARNAALAEDVNDGERNLT